MSHRFDRRALPLADAHYNRRKVGSPQFVPPGRCLVLLTADAGALIREALAASRAFFGEPPPLGLVTFIDRSKTKSKRDPGYCYLKAGFEPDGETAGGLIAVRIRPERMPPPAPPIGMQAELHSVTMASLREVS